MKGLFVNGFQVDAVTLTTSEFFCANRMWGKESSIHRDA